MKETFIFPDVLKSIKINVLIFQQKHILIKGNIYLPDDRESVKLQCENLITLYHQLLSFSKVLILMMAFEK